MAPPDIVDLLAQLEDEHEEGRHLYRGQLARYPPHRWTAHGEEREVEALYPADYRFHYQHKDFSARNSERILQRVTAARAYGRTLREQFITFLVLLMNGENEAGWDWARNRFPELVEAVENRTAPQDTQFFRAAWSLAQHYLVATALTDLTYSTRVAAWFATEPWESGGPRPEDGALGVIYRIDGPFLTEILERATALSHAMSTAEGSAPAPEFFLVDIRDVPEALAKRPSAQQGASVYGFDQAHVIGAAMKGGAIQAFEFEHRSGAEIGIDREDVVPSQDPFLEPLARFRAARMVMRPDARVPAEGEASAADALERANSALELGLTGARQVKQIALKEDCVGWVFDEVERIGEIRFRYLMIVEDQVLRSALCAISAEPMKLAPGLPPQALAAFGFGPLALRLWGPGRSMTVDYGDWDAVDAFVERASKVAGDVISAGGG